VANDTVPSDLLGRASPRLAEPWRGGSAPDAWRHRCRQPRWRGPQERSL